MIYVGMDIHKKFTFAVAKDKEKNKLREMKFNNSKENFSSFFEGFDPQDTSIAMESSSVWEYIYELLESLNYNKISLVNPTKTRLIAESTKKTDKIDANYLCDLLIGGDIYDCYIPPKEIRELRSLTRARNALEKQATQIKNQIHAMLTKRGITLPTEGLGIKSLEFLIKEQEHNFILLEFIKQMKELQERIELFEGVIRVTAGQNDEARRLMTIYGIAEIRAMEIVAEIGDIGRFKSSERLASYAGLVPGVRQSGTVIHYGNLIKTANLNLKRVLVEAAWSLIRCPGKNRFREMFDKLNKKKGSQIAICAVARKLCCTIYAMLSKKQDFILI